MTRTLSDASGLYLPAAYRTDTSVARQFIATYGDPNRPASGLVVAVGDVWLDAPWQTSPIAPPPAVYPPGPPGTYEPTAATVGPAPAGYNPIPYPATGGPAGDIVSDVLTLADSGIVLTGYTIDARIKVTGSNISLKGCVVRGGAAVTSGNDVGLIDCSAATVKNFLIEDSEIAPKNPSAWANCFRGHDFTEQRNNVHGGCDNYDYFPAATGGPLNVNRFATWAHDLAAFSPDSIGRTWPHSDVGQWTGGSGLTITGCSDWGFFDPAIGDASNPALNPNKAPDGTVRYNSNSSMLITQLQGNCRGLAWTNSWAYGGGAGLNFNAKGGTAGNVGVIDNLQVGHDQFFQGGSPGVDGVYGSGGDNTVAILSVGGLTFSKLNIFYKDNGHPVNTGTLRVS